jgi:hypothetical protein
MRYPQLAVSSQEQYLLGMAGSPRTQPHTIKARIEMHKKSLEILGFSRW